MAWSSACAVLAFAARSFCLSFGQGFLDGVKVGRVGRHVEQLRAGLLDSLANTVYLMRAEVVRHDHISEFQLRCTSSTAHRLR